MNDSITNFDKAIFIGAHPDDIEIGAGGTVAKLVELGCNIWVFILTSDSDPSICLKRKQEAIKACNSLGIDSSKVIFLDFEDTKLKNDGDSVRKLREILNEKSLDNENAIVFTHTLADDHNDHKEANGITCATFRKSVIFLYPVVNSSGSVFKPKFFVDISAQYSKKINALEEHQSQKDSGRIRYQEMDKFSEHYSNSIGLKKIEAFEIYIQTGADIKFKKLINFNDSPFYRFWYSLISDTKLLIIHAVPVYRKNKHWTWQSDKDREGLNLLMKNFSEQWFDIVPIDIYSSQDIGVEDKLNINNILLSGGAVSNTIVRTYFNHFKGIRYMIDYEMPDFTNIHIYDSLKDKKVFAVYREDQLNNRIVVEDIGILTVMKNPLNKNKYIIGCMGIHGFATLGCYKALTNPKLLYQLMSIFNFPLTDNGYQILLKYFVQEDKIRFLENTLHKIEY